jgi:hypothetical protein
MKIMWLALCLSLSLGTPTSEPAVLVVLGPPTAFAEQAFFGAFEQLLAQEKLLGLPQLYLRLTGQSDFAVLSRKELQKTIDEAQRLEANFQSGRAAALRQEGMNKFQRVLQPSEALRDLAPELWVAQVAALLDAEQPIRAFEWALKARAMFAQLKIDAARYTPALVALFKNAGKALEKEPHLELHLSTSVSGDVVLSSGVLAKGKSQFVLKVPHLVRRIWFKHEGKFSLPYPLPPFGAHYALHIDMDLDQRLFFKPWLGLTCTQTCVADAVLLQKRLRVPRLFVWRLKEDTPSLERLVLGDTPHFEKVILTKTIVPPKSSTKFSPAILAPFGLGQFYQKRVAMGVILSVVETALLGWHVWAWQRHAAALDKNDLALETQRREERNLSAGFFYGAVVIGLGEALWQHFKGLVAE